MEGQPRRLDEDDEDRPWLSAPLEAPEAHAPRPGVPEAQHGENFTAPAPMSARRARTAPQAPRAETRGPQRRFTRNDLFIAAQNPAPSQKWRDPYATASGAPRAWAPLSGSDAIGEDAEPQVGAEALWVDAVAPDGTPLSRNAFGALLAEAVVRGWPLQAVTITAPPSETGWPTDPLEHPSVLNGLAEHALRAGLKVTVRSTLHPLGREEEASARACILDLADRFGDAFLLAAPLHHHTIRRHDEIAGPGALRATLAAARWALTNGVRVRILGRRLENETEGRARSSFKQLFKRMAAPIDAWNAAHLGVAPPPETPQDPPELSTACWRIVRAHPAQTPCARLRHVAVSSGGAPRLRACPLIRKAPAFAKGATLASAEAPTLLSHPRCVARCVLDPRALEDDPAL